MAAHKCALILASLALVCQSYATESTSQQYVTKECNNKLRNIDSIAKFKEFVGHYNDTITHENKPKKGILNLEKRVRKCFDLRDALLELEQIIDSRYDGVCRMSYINRLIEFKMKHLLRGAEESNRDLDRLDDKFSYVAFFFSIYAHQVASQCKNQLSARLQDSQKHYDCKNIIVEMVPELPRNTDGNQDSDLKDISVLLSDFDQVENFVPIVHLKHLRVPETHIDVIIPNSAIERFEVLQKECKKIEPYYTATLSPIGALAQFGYQVDSAQTDSDSEDILKCWLGAAQLCQGILRTHLEANDKLDQDQNSSGASKFISVKLEGSPTEVPTQNDGDDELNFKDYFEEISPEMVDLVKKRLTLVSKAKWRASNLIKQLIERRINIQASQETALRGLLESIKSMENDIDKTVSFAGRAVNIKSYNAASIVTDNTDSIIRTASPFFNKEAGLLASCVIGIVMSAVFVYFSIYALATTLKQKQPSFDDHSIKDWHKLRNERVEKVKAKLTKDSRGIFGQRVYKRD